MLNEENYYKNNGFNWQNNIDDLFIQATHILYSKVSDKVGDVKNKKILDAACGLGKLVPYLSNPIYYGIDISAENIKICKEKFPNEFLIGDILSMRDQFTDNFFDGLVAVEVIEHLTIDEFRLFLKEISRITKPGSKIVFSTPNLYYLWGMIPWSFIPIRRRLTLSMMIKGIKRGYVNENYNIPSHHYRFKPRFLKNFISEFLEVKTMGSTYWYNNRAIHKKNEKFQLKILNFSSKHNPKWCNIGMQLIIECVNNK